MALRFSTAGVGDYIAKCKVGPNLPSPPLAADLFAIWFLLAGHQVVTAWKNADVWGTDFVDGTDLAPDGGTDVPEIYFYCGHGICTPNHDYIMICGNKGPQHIRIGETFDGMQTRWGSKGGKKGGKLRFLFLDASCPMDLSTLAEFWFPSFQGLHIATGHSGDANHDSVDSYERANDFSAIMNAYGPIYGYWALDLSVGDAWMQAGLIEVQQGVSAVALAAGGTKADAIKRRDFEQINSGWSDPTPKWFAWKWVTL